MADESIANLPAGANPTAATIFPVTESGNTAQITMAQISAYLQSQLTFFTMPAGSVLEYELATAPTGWLFLNGSTIGDDSSGATARANADQATLYAGLWAAQGNTILVIQDSSGNPTTRGANAAADFAAHKRLPLPNRCGRVSIGTGQGATAEGGGTGTNRVLGVSGGAETHTQIAAEIASHGHSVPANGGGGASSSVVSEASVEVPNQGENIASTLTGSGSAMAIMNPFRVTNYIIKY